jgi:hypothetical protein
MYNCQGTEPSPAELIQVGDKTLCHYESSVQPGGAGIEW